MTIDYKGLLRKSFSCPTRTKILRHESRALNNYFQVLKKASIVFHGKETEHTKNERSILEAIKHPFSKTKINKKLSNCFMVRKKESIQLN